MSAAINKQEEIAVIDNSKSCTWEELSACNSENIVIVNTSPEDERLGLHKTFLLQTITFYWEGLQEMWPHF